MTPKAKVYENVIVDYRRLTRELDVAMHGKEGAAKQASLCDLIPLAKRMRSENLKLRAALEHAMEMVTDDDDCVECKNIRKLLGWPA